MEDILLKTKNKDNYVRYLRIQRLSPKEDRSSNLSKNNAGKIDSDKVRKKGRKRFNI